VEFIPLADVTGNGETALPGVDFDAFDGGLAGIQLATGDDHRGPGTGGGEGDLISQTAAAAGDDGDLSVQGTLAGHGSITFPVATSSSISGPDNPTSSSTSRLCS